jgi:hypothetical protein
LNQNLSAHQNVICKETKPQNDPWDIVSIEDPCQRASDLAAAWAHQIYSARLQKLSEDFEGSLRAKASQVGEHFTVDYTNLEYHYTLYYYDMAGTFVKTVPPKGVRPRYDDFAEIESDKQNSIINRRDHQLETNYRYNTLNKDVSQNYPDAQFLSLTATANEKVSRFWYDRVGRLAISHNPEQELHNKYSYTR